MTLSEIREKIYIFSLIDILKSKKLSYDFVCKYILNPDFQFTPEEEKIDISMVCEFQPHLKKEFENQPKMTLSKNSSWPNFEEIALNDEIRRKKLLNSNQTFNSCPNLNELSVIVELPENNLLNRASENSSCPNLESLSQ